MNKTRRINLDLALDNTDPPSVDDIVTTARAAYRVAGVRPIESRVWPNRWALALILIPNGGDNTHPPTPSRPGQRVHPTSSYRRGETPSMFFGVEP